jgi:hypothetical protein
MAHKDTASTHASSSTCDANASFDFFKALRRSSPRSREFIAKVARVRRRRSCFVTGTAAAAVEQTIHIATRHGKHVHRPPLLILSTCWERNWRSVPRARNTAPPFVRPDGSVARHSQNGARPGN